MSELKDLHSKNLSEKCSSETQFNKTIKRHKVILQDSSKSNVNLYMQICSLYELVIECNYKHSNGVIFEPCVVNKVVKMYINKSSVLRDFVDKLHNARTNIVHNMPRLESSFKDFVTIMNSCTRKEFIIHMELCTWNLATEIDFGKFYDLFYIPKKKLNFDELPDIE